MDASSYKDFTTSRGLTYNYYFAAPADGKLTLLLLHGFPSTSYDWRHQISFFKQEGYGLIVPNMLGYAPTSQPTDASAYVAALVSKDLVELVDSESTRDVVVIGHDWGSKYCGRLACYYPDRFRAYAFLAVGYGAPGPNIKFEDFLAFMTKVAGYEPLGYWSFLANDPDAPQLLREHQESFMSILYAKDARNLLRKHFCPTGELKTWLSENNIAELCDWLPKEDFQEGIARLFHDTSFAGPTNYYKTFVHGHDGKDNEGIAKENYKISKPTFFGAAVDDPIIPWETQTQRMMPGVDANQFTLKKYAAGHWVQVEAHVELNKDLLSWVQSL